jgi:site-specific DNA-cytosine methylase
MRILELFAGTGSIGEAYQSENWEVLSLDINKKAKPTICCDIMLWDYTIYEPGHFDAVWASPVCTHYSVARTNAKTPRDFVWADGLVLKTLEIIRYFDPPVWYIENPQSGLLKTRPFMENLDFTDADYCRYCYWGYRKRTRIWTNSDLQGKLCLGVGKCPNMKGKQHLKTAQRGARIIEGERDKQKHSVEQLYRIPPELCEAIVKSSTA